MTFPDALSQCIIAGRYRDAVLQHNVLLQGTVVMYYRGAFHNVS